MSWHELDVGPPEPDWGQRHDGPRPEPDPEPDVTFHVAEPDPDPDPEPDVTFFVTEPEPDPEPDWDRLRGDEPQVDEPPVDEPDPDPAPRGVRHVTSTRHVFSDPVIDTPGGLILRPRQRLGSHRGDLETIELGAYYKEPKWVLVMKRRNNAHWW